MTVLVVRDRAWIEESLRAIPFRKTIRLLDAGGKPVATPDASKLAPVATADRSSTP